MAGRVALLIDRVGNCPGATRQVAFPSGALREKRPRRLLGSVVFEASIARHLEQVRMRCLRMPRWEHGRQAPVGGPAADAAPGLACRVRGQVSEAGGDWELEDNEGRAI